jgi:hypothetical protein
MANVDTHILSILEKKQSSLVLPKGSLKLISSNFSRFWLTTYAMFGGRIFQQTVGIPMGTNCAFLLADLFLHSYDKRDDFNFPIVNFSVICSNIPAAPAYGIYISKLFRYSWACGTYQDFFDIRLLITKKLLNQGFLVVKLKSSVRMFSWITRYAHNRKIGKPNNSRA